MKDPESILFEIAESQQGYFTFQQAITAEFSNKNHAYHMKERHYRKIIPLNDDVYQAVEEIRKELWDLYKGLKEYELEPSEALRAVLEQKFEDLFLHKKTISRSLNE